MHGMVCGALHPQNSYVEILLPDVMVLGDDVWEIIGNEGGALMGMRLVCCKTDPRIT